MENSSFVQVMKDWRRMCKAYTTDDDESCCDGCPIMALEIDEHVCGAIFSEWSDKADWEEVEDVIETWAAEHPEPVYPTWLEWLEKMGIMADIHDRLKNYKQVMEVCGKPLYSIPTTKVFCSIPADIAEKLGLQPKEG